MDKINIQLISYYRLYFMDILHNIFHSIKETKENMPHIPYFNMNNAFLLDNFRTFYSRHSNIEVQYNLYIYLNTNEDQTQDKYIYFHYNCKHVFINITYIVQSMIPNKKVDYILYIYYLLSSMDYPMNTCISLFGCHKKKFMDKTNISNLINSNNKENYMIYKYYFNDMA